VTAVNGSTPELDHWRDCIHWCGQESVLRDGSGIQRALTSLLALPGISGVSLHLAQPPGWHSTLGEQMDAAGLRAAVHDGGEVLGELTIAGTPSANTTEMAAQLIGLAATVARQQHKAVQMEERLQKLNRNQNDFVRIVSHDLRAPLTSIRGFTEMLELGVGGELNDNQRQFTEKIMSGIVQMAALVENIQDAGRFDPETGFYEMSRSPVDLGELVGRVVHNHLVPAEKEALAISVGIADDLPIIYADANMLERAVTNLVDNAIKYTPNGGRIEISVMCEGSAAAGGNRLRVSVRDNGFGIKPEDQAQLFQRHVRLVRADQKRIKGTGLGLFIVRSVAQQHQGEAWVESIPAEGSTFSFSIPLKGANLLGILE